MHRSIRPSPVSVSNTNVHSAACFSQPVVCELSAAPVGLRACVTLIVSHPRFGLFQLPSVVTDESCPSIEPHPVAELINRRRVISVAGSVRMRCQRPR